jgi:hypothetical protein
MAKADPDITSEPLPLPPRPLTPQERADLLLQRWRLSRAAGLPPAFRLDGDGQRHRSKSSPTSSAPTRSTCTAP